MNLRRSNDRLGFIMGITYQQEGVFLVNNDPGTPPFHLIDCNSFNGWVLVDHICLVGSSSNWNNLIGFQPDDVIKWKHCPCYWPFVRGIHRSPMNSPHKGQWHGAFMFSLICAWINGWVNNRVAGDLRRHRAHYDVTVMCKTVPCPYINSLWLSDVLWYQTFWSILVQVTACHGWGAKQYLN